MRKRSSVSFLLSIVCLFMFSKLVASASANESVICIGAHWGYKFKFGKSGCLQEQKVIKDIPGAYKKGHINKFEQVNPEECWKSISKIQMDFAKCCMAENSTDISISCDAKKIAY